jgi:signal transduction histidine kinase
VSLTLAPLPATRRGLAAAAAAAATASLSVSSGSAAAQRQRREQDRRHRDLEREARHALEASRLKSEFLADMSHELRTPLNAIIGFTEMLHDGKAGTVDERQLRYLGHILSSSRHLLELLNDLLDLAKVEAGKMDFRPQRLAPAPLASEVIDTLRGPAAEQRIRVELQLDPAVGEVRTDAAKLKQILFNFLSNALKTTPPGGSVVVRILAQGEDDFRVEVEDTGDGIPPERLDRLFTNFEQLGSRAARQTPGTGLGLAVTKRLVEAQGGSVGARSVLGQGSLFFAVLPGRVEPRPPPRSL